MDLADQLRSTSFRVGIAYAILFFVSVMAILGTTYVFATAEMEGIVRLAVTEDIARFRTALRDGGEAGLLEAVREAREALANEGFFLVLDREGHRIEGNLPASLWSEGASDRKLGADVIRANPPLATAASGNPGDELRLFGVGARLGDDSVMAGRNAHTLEETQEVILSALVWGSIPTTMLALVGGFAVSIGPTRRVDAIAATMRSVAAGRFDLRLPISPRKDELDRLSGDINGMLERISRLMSSLKQVSTDIAHDLRTPLARLRQRLEGARNDAVSAGGDGATIETAIVEVDSIIETFNALLRIAEIEAGARKAKFVRLDLSALLLQIHDVFETVAEESGHRLEIGVEPGLSIEGDRDLLQQLFANLVENAMTHVPAPGHIRIGLARTADAVVASVADDGPGIPQDERAKVFRRLYRLDRSRTTPGNGLGLALAAAIADLHGAEIRALDHRPGLLMEIRFPARPADPAAGPRMVEEP